MAINITERLNFLELEVDDFIKIQFKNSTCLSAYVQEIKDNSLDVINEDEQEFTFYYEEIENIDSK